MESMSNGEFYKIYQLFNKKLTHKSFVLTGADMLLKLSSNEKPITRW